MKKTFIILLILSLMFISACKDESKVNKTTTTSMEPTTVEVTITESVTSSIPTSEEVEAWGTYERWELGQKNMRYLSENAELSANFDFDELDIEIFARKLVKAGAREIKELTVEKVLATGFMPICMKDVKGKIYYMTANNNYYGEVCTKEEWMMAKKLKPVISQNFNFDESESENVSEILAKSGVQEIVSLDIEEYLNPGASVSYPVTRIEDVTGAIYYASIETEGVSIGFVSVVKRGSWEGGEVVFEAMGGFVSES